MTIVLSISSLPHYPSPSHRPCHPVFPGPASPLRHGEGCGDCVLCVRGARPQGLPVPQREAPAVQRQGGWWVGVGTPHKGALVLSTFILPASLTVKKIAPLPCVQGKIRLFKPEVTC